MKELKVGQVANYKYLRTVIEENTKIDGEINERIKKVGKIYNNMKSTFLGKREIDRKIKTEVVRKIVKPVMMYGAAVDRG